MNPQLITETSLAGLRPLGVGGRRVLESWHEIDAAIRAHLDPRYAQLLAEPVLGERGIVWFAEPEGEVVPYTSLPPEEAAELVRETAHRVARLTELVATLQASSAPDVRRLADTLERALSVPSEVEGRGFLYAIRRPAGAGSDRVVAEPVLVNWGTRDDLPDPPVGVLEFFLKKHAPPPEIAPDPPPASPDTLSSRSDRPPSSPPTAPVPPRPAPPAEPPPAREQAAGQNEPPTPSPVVGRAEHPARAGTALLWLLLAVLVAFGLYLVLPACGLRGPFFTLFASCDATAGDIERKLAAASQRGAELEAQLAELEAQMAELPPCAVVPGAAPSGAAPPRAATPPETERLDGELRAAGGTVGEVALTLEWQGDSDLDLAVICPGGARISFLPEERRQAACANGVLDVDANANPSTMRDHPIENITWPAAPPIGQYRVEVRNFDGRSNGNAAVPFRLRIKNGTDQQMVEDLVAPRENPVSHSFAVR